MDKKFIAKILTNYNYFENLSKEFTRNYLRVRNRWLELEMRQNHKFFLIETKKGETPKIDSFSLFNRAEEEYFKIATTRLQQKTSGLKESEGGV